MREFYTEVKSTIDKLAVDLADVAQVGFLELDDPAADELLGDASTLLLYRFDSMVPDPRPPLWRVVFQVGIKTVSDAGNYQMSMLMQQVQTKFSPDEQYPVYDYSGTEVPADSSGYLYITETRTDPQMFEGISGIRLVEIVAVVAET